MKHPSLPPLLLSLLLISGCTDPEPGAPVKVDPYTLVAKNYLLGPVQLLTVNGRRIDAPLNPDQTDTFRFGELDTSSLRYVIRPTPATPWGDTIYRSSDGSYTFHRTYDTGYTSIAANTDDDPGPDIFTPMIVNNASVPIVVGINMETDLENRTGITLQPGDSGRFIGYYHLPRGGANGFANVRIYRTDKAWHPTDYLVSQYGLGFNDSNIDRFTAVFRLNVNQDPP